MTYLWEDELEVVYELGHLKTDAIVRSDGTREGREATHKYVEVVRIDAQVLSAAAREGAVREGDLEKHLALIVRDVAERELVSLYHVDPALVCGFVELLHSRGREE